MEPLAEEIPWADALAARLRLLQASCADDTPENRQAFIFEEIERALQKISPSKKKAHLDALLVGGQAALDVCRRRAVEGDALSPPLVAAGLVALDGLPLPPPPPLHAAATMAVVASIAAKREWIGCTMGRLLSDARARRHGPTVPWRDSDWATDPMAAVIQRTSVV